MNNTYLIALVFLGKLIAYEIVSENYMTKELGYNNCDMQTNGELDLMQRLIHLGDVVFDVGANVGEWSSNAIELGGSIHLYAFEPLPGIFSDLKRRLSNYSNAHAFNFALSNNIGSANFCFYDEGAHSALSGFYEREVLKGSLQPPKMIKVDQDTLTHFCLNQSIDKIDFLKIDTEGAEWIILQGASELIKQNKISAIQFEYGGCHIDAKTRLEDFFYFLTRSGYLIFRIIPNGLIQITEWSPHLENFSLANYIAMKELVFSSHFPHRTRS